jgi:SAM-dependent methyltransferase
MDRMTKHYSEQNIALFYDLLSTDYDRMTDFANRYGREKSFFESLVQQYNIRKALDAGCGTGFHSLLLSQLGVDVTAVDISNEMLRQVRQHGGEMNRDIKTRNLKFTDLKKEIKTTFDAVFCLGNSLAHLHSQKELKTTIDNFYAVLNPGGILVLQVLNYDRILKMRDRIISVKEFGGKLFIRFYDFLPQNIIFNILTIDKGAATPNRRLQSIEIRPVRAKELITALRQTGFTTINTYGSIRRDNFSSATSTDLLITAIK